MNRNLLKAEIIRNGYSQQDMAKIIGITPKTFYTKMKKGVFGTDEVKVLIDTLDLKNPMEIFFDK